MEQPDFTILVVDSTGRHRTSIEQARAALVARVSEVRTSSDAFDTLESHAADAVVACLEPPDMPAGDFVRQLGERWPGMPVLLLASSPGIPEVVDLVRAGAQDVLVEPLEPDQLALSLKKAHASVRRLATPPPPSPAGNAEMPYGDSKAMSKVRALVEQVGPTSSTVLIRGESGTGKEIVARALHRASHRAARALIKIDCTALPEPLLESELFGHEKGAFTGAGQRKLGRVELAQGGTLFLDEVGELTLPTQAKLLRLLQDRVLERLGGTQTISVDVRVVAATHRDLETMVERGEFRHDLFYRLNVIPIWIPPLRARREDIPELVRRFASDVAQRNGGVPKTFDEEAIRLISSERWPGNVRQLQNFVERLVVLSRSGAVSRSDVLGELQRPIQFATQTGPAGADAAAAPEPAGDDAALRLARHSAEREALVRALEQAGGKRSTAAKILGVCRSTLYLKLAEHGLS